MAVKRTECAGSERRAECRVIDMWVSRVIVMNLVRLWKIAFNRLWKLR
jgi:hypothetical protein